MKNPDLATAFHALHRGPEPLILANAWDAGSARLIESLGARAIATTSAGVAWVHGYPDGGTPDLLCAKIARIRRVAGELGVDLFINARTDVYLRGLVPEASRIAETR